MKPRHLLTILCLLAFFQTVVSQKEPDKIIMQDGTVHIGKYISKDSTYIRFREGEYAVDFQTIYVPIADIDKMTLHLGEGRKQTELANEFRGFHQDTAKVVSANLKTPRVYDTGYHLSKGGKFGITGVVFLVSGSILGIVGAIKGIPALTYTGAGVSGLGGIFLIVPFGQMIRAGNKYPKPN
jgi:hypothetical protein